MGKIKVFKSTKGIGEKINKKKKRLQTNNKTRKIRTTLILSFMVPIFLIIVLGVISYKQASQAIIEKSVESADSTMVAMNNYIKLLSDNFKSKTTEMLVNDNFSDYYQKYYDNDSAEALETFNAVDKQMGLVQIATPYLRNYYVIAEKGNTIFSAPYSSSLPKEVYELFLKSDGKAYSTNEKISSMEWIGNHDYLDKQLKIDKSTYAFSFVLPFTSGSNSGVMLWDMDKTYIDKALMSMGFGKNAIKGIITQDGRENLIVDKVDKTTGKIISTGIEGTKVFVGNKFYSNSLKLGKAGHMDVTYKNKNYLYIYTPIGDTKMMMCALIPKASILESANNIKKMTIMLVAFAALIALLLGTGIATGISRVLISICMGLEKAAAGKLNERFDTKRKDEFRLLTDRMTGMLSGICGIMKNTSIFSYRVMNSADLVSKISDGILESMKYISRNIDEISGGVTTQSEDTLRCATDLMDFSEKMDNVYHDTEQMGKIADITRETVDTGKFIVDELSEKSEASTKITNILVVEIDEVIKQSESIVDIIELINMIASETNMLSLNASIESARAGVYGRGFAVVAEEIRKLAEQSTQAGNKVKEMVDVIRVSTNNTTNSVKQMEEYLISQNKSLRGTIEVFENINNQVNTLVENIKKVQQNMTMMMEHKEDIVGSIQGISAVSQEITASTEEVNSSISVQLDEIQKLVEEAEQLNTEANKLKENMSTFVLE
jgi:Methyl-accepting chemotaxis protein